MTGHGVWWRQILTEEMALRYRDHEFTVAIGGAADMDGTFGLGRLRRE